MWDEIIKRLPNYESAVITGVNRQGYPVSMRCKPQPDSAAQVLKIGYLDDSYLQPGSASLLFHKYDEQFWNLQSFIVWGRLERADSDWIFHPERFTPGAATDAFNSPPAKRPTPAPPSFSTAKP